MGKRLQEAVKNNDRIEVFHCLNDYFLANNDRQEALRFVVSGGNLELAREFFEAFKIDATSEHLQLALNARHHDMVIYIISMKVPIDKPHWLYDALARQMYETIDALLEKGLMEKDADEYFRRDFLSQSHSDKDVRYYVKMGGWIDGLNPRDYLYELSIKRHGHHPALVEYLSKMNTPILSKCRVIYSDIVVECIE